MDIIHNIDDIHTLITNFISGKKSLLNNLNLNVEVIEIKSYANMVFMKVKDKSANIKAIIFKFNYGVTLKPGDEININASLRLYKGDLELIIKTYKLLGTGNSLVEFQSLKNKLDKLGYFNRNYKLKNNYDRIGVISSMNAAGMKDFMYTLTNRCYGKEIYIYQSTMQGDAAPNEVKNAISLANKHNKVEILVLIRGGGSKDDLECFNSEIIANAIYTSSIPIVSGIGHQIDTTLADLVSHKNFITPTAVAQNITTENKISKNLITQKIKEIHTKLILKLNNYYDYITQQQHNLNTYQTNIIKYIDNIKLQKQLITKNNHNLIKNYLNNYYDYILKSTLDMSHIINILNNASQQKRLQLNNLIEKTNNKINYYQENLNTLTKPKILNGNKEITTFEEFKKCKSYTIEFLDGNINIQR